MIAAFYAFLKSLGYPHPVHPAIAHMPIGLMTGALVFGFVSLWLRRPILGWSARHCLILAWLFWFPTVVFGIMDWQYFLAGAWIFPIEMKLILAGILFLLLSIGILVSRNPDTGLRGPLIVYALSFFCVVGLGWYGGNLVFGARTIPAAKEYKVGMEIFDVNCSGCHPHGGNIIKPNLTLSGAPELADFHDFLAYIRHPLMPDGSKGIMPAFPEKKISDPEAGQLYKYLVKVLSVRSKK
ncbi:MAG: c-type cytochrome [Syntrophobacterales bacterium]|jgi:mono/diheme cytochrome c family protein